MISEKLFGFLNEAGDPAAFLWGMCGGRHDYYSIFRGVFHLCDHHGGLLAMTYVKVNHGLQGEFTDYVRVEHEKEGALLCHLLPVLPVGGCQQQVFCQSYRPSSPERLLLLAANNPDLILHASQCVCKYLSYLLLEHLDLLLHNLGLIVDCEDDLSNTGLREGLYLVAEDRLVREVY